MLSERFLLLPPPIDISAIIRHFYMCVIMDLQQYLLCVMMSLSIETDVSILFNQETKRGNFC
jgi:hypothetical protein